MYERFTPHSDSIESLVYDAKRRRLHVSWQSGSSTEYQDVPAEVAAVVEVSGSVEEVAGKYASISLDAWDASADIPMSGVAPSLPLTPTQFMPTLIDPPIISALAEDVIPVLWGVEVIIVDTLTLSGGGGGNISNTEVVITDTVVLASGSYP